jgi:hypothetical protein
MRNAGKGRRVGGCRASRSYGARGAALVPAVATGTTVEARGDAEGLAVSTGVGGSMGVGGGTRVGTVIVTTVGMLIVGPSVGVGTSVGARVPVGRAVGLGLDTVVAMGVYIDTIVTVVLGVGVLVAGGGWDSGTKVSVPTSKANACPSVDWSVRRSPTASTTLTGPDSVGI